MTSANRTTYDVFQLDETVWNVASDVREAFFTRDGFCFRSWIEQGAAKLVKSGSGRSIYYVQIPGLHLYVKHFEITPGTANLYRALRQGRAEKEYEVARLLWQSGVPTIRPLALGERRRNGLLEEAFLITEAIPNGMTLFELIEDHVRTGAMEIAHSHRRQIIHEVARLTAALHRAGLEHRDLHERNLIYQKLEDDRFRLYLVDLHELEKHRHLEWSSTVNELARLGRYFSIRTERTDRLRFFRHYAHLRQLDGRLFKSFAREVEYETIESRADFWRRRDVRATNRMSGTKSILVPGGKAWAQEDLPHSFFQRFAADPEKFLATSIRHWWKRGKGTNVGAIQLDELDPDRTQVVKKYIHPPVRELFASWGRDNAATRAWKNGLALRLRELPTPRPLMLVHRYKGMLLESSYLLTERVDSSLTIAEYLSDEIAPLPENERRRVLRGCIIRAASLLRRMHDRRVTHHDLKATNILATKTSDLAHPDLWLIDLDGVQTWQRIPDADLLQNIARFAVSFMDNRHLSRTDRLRFVKRYLGAGSQNKKTWKALWRAIDRWATEKIQRNRRRGRAVG